MEGLIVFLERTTADHAIPQVIYAPPNDQPRAVTNAAGGFTISRVPDGEYVVVVFSPPADVQVFTHPNNDQPLLITAVAGAVINLGVVRLLQ